MNPQCHPGIWVVRERVPRLKRDGMPELDADKVALWDMASEAERKQMWEEDLSANRIADAAYAEVVIQKADQDAEDPRKIPFIAEKTKAAAKHYGIERDWLRPIADSDMKRCPYCDALLSAYVAVCKVCHNVVDAERYAALEAKKQMVLKRVS
jgi:hypothetical protein